MTTECKTDRYEFQGVGNRAVEASFDGGMITSDGGALLLRELEQRRQIMKQLAACFTDYRDPAAIEHPLEDLIGQRVVGLVLGYEDLVDHDQLRSDPLLATVVGKRDPTGQDRRRVGDRGKPLAGKSRLNRLELRTDDPAQDGVYKKIAVNGEAVDRLFVELYVQAQEHRPEQVLLDLDATDDPLHGQQEGRFFHGYYGHYCYLPLYIFSDDHLLSARLPEANQDPSVGALEDVKRVVGQLRERWPAVPILLRGDAGFAGEEIMTWCEQNQVEYIFGLAKNARFLAQIEKPMEPAQVIFEMTGRAARVFSEFFYQPRESWSRARRVVAKAEHLEKGANPRFIVTSLGGWEAEARPLYEQTYCARGEMENRIKEQQLDLFADRTSAHQLKSNQLRLWFSSVA